MSKANKKKGFWFYLGRLMATIGIVLLLAVLSIYLTVPTYSFETPGLRGQPNLSLAVP